MRGRWGVCLALLLCLCSCASLLEREYTVTSPHVEKPPPQGDTAYRVETYPALRSALLSYVEEGMEEGLLRFPTTYPGNLSVDMEKAKRQLLEEDPLGCYALSDLTYHTSKIIAYYEVELGFTYKVDKKALSMPRVTSQSALVTLLGKCLETRQEELCVYLTAYPEGEEDYFDAALAEAWTALHEQAEEDPSPGPDEPQGEPTPAQESEPPEAGTGLPVVTAELYPQTGVRRVAVLKLDYSPEEGGTPS